MADLDALAADPRLRDEVVRLRPWRADDADAVFAACQDSRIARFVPIPQPYTMAIAEGYVAFAAAATATGPDVHLAITDPSNDAVLGEISRHGGDDHRAWFGYWLPPRGSRRGVATRALQLLVDWTLATTDVIRVELYTDPDNDASGRVALRLASNSRGSGGPGTSAGTVVRSTRCSTSASGRWRDDPRRPRDPRSTADGPPPAARDAEVRVAQGGRGLARSRAVAGLRAGEVVGGRSASRGATDAELDHAFNAGAHPAHACAAAHLALRASRGHPLDRELTGPRVTGR